MAKKSIMDYLGFVPYINMPDLPKRLEYDEDARDKARLRILEQTEDSRTVKWTNHKGQTLEGKVIRENAKTLWVEIDGKPVKVRRKDLDD